MAIGFRASSAAGAASSSQVSSQAITIPAAVAAGDVLVVYAVQVPISATLPVLSIASTGTAPVAAAAQQSASESLPATLGAQPWTVVCGAGDAGKVITVSSKDSGGTNLNGFWSLAVAAYTGVDNTTPVDVIGGTATAGGNATTVTCPAESTVTAGDWAVYLGGGAGEGGNLNAPSGSTQRISEVQSGINVFAVIADGNASAGSAGTSIGGGTFTTSSASNSILAAFTLGLKPAGSSTNHPGAAALSGTGALTAAGLAVVPAAAALSGSGSLTAGANVPGQESAALSGTGSLTAGRAVAYKAGASLSGTGTLTAAGAVVPQFSAVFSSTDGNGVQTWTVTSALNGPSTSVLRILPPTLGSGSFPHSFTFMLPVSTGTDATFGDPLSVMESLGACNTYNTTAVVPSFPIQPWYADNPNNLQQSQESFMLALAQWMSTSTFSSGGEKNYLIGFSKSGIGGQGLQFHRPDVWAACASWDAPFMMTDYDGTDPTNGGTVGGNSATCYGTSANFKTNYELSAAHLTTWAATGNLTTRRRLWIGGYFTFQADVNAYMTRLTSAGIRFDGSHDTLDTSHAWHDGWVADALASIMIDPEFLGAAALSGSGSLTAGGQVTQPAAAALSGSGALTAARLVTQPAAASLSGSGTLTVSAAVQFTSAAVLSGSGSLTEAALVTQPAAAVLAGSGLLAAAASVQFTLGAALSGTGTLTAAGSVSGLSTGSAALSGSGALAAAVAVTVPASAALSGQGTITAAVVIAAPSGVPLSGTGALSVGPVLAFAAAVTLAGTGTLAAFVQVITPVSEPPVTWSAQPAALRWRAAPAPPRWTVTPSPTRWRVVMALFPPIAAISLECVNVIWLSNLDGTAVDPTGASSGQPALPVQFAFPQTSGNHAEPAQPVTWFTGSWLLGGTGKGFVAQALIGPGGGVVTLTAGQQYDVWSMVSGSPESPARFVGVQSVY